MTSYEQRTEENIRLRTEIAESLGAPMFVAAPQWRKRSEQIQENVVNHTHQQHVHTI